MLKRERSPDVPVRNLPYSISLIFQCMKMCPSIRARRRTPSWYCHPARIFFTCRGPCEPRNLGKRMTHPLSNAASEKPHFRQFLVKSGSNVGCRAFIKPCEACLGSVLPRDKGSRKASFPCAGN